MIRLSEPERQNGGQIEDWCLSFFLPTTNRMLLSAGILAEQLGRYLARSYKEVMSANVTSQFLETDVTNSEMEKIPKSIGVFLDLTFVDMPGQELSVELTTNDINKLIRDLKESGKRHSMFWQESERGTLPEEYVSTDMAAIRRMISDAIIECLEKIASDEGTMKLLYEQNMKKLRKADEITHAFAKDQIFRLIFDENGGGARSTPMITKGKG